MAGVTREILAQQQVDEPQVDVAEVGCVLMSSRSKSAATTRERSLARSNSAITSASVSLSPTTKLGSPPRRATATFALGQARQDVLEPDPFGDRGMLEQSDRGGPRRDETAAGLIVGQTAHRIDQFGAIAVEHALEQVAFGAGGDLRYRPCHCRLDSVGRFGFSCRTRAAGLSPRRRTDAGVVPYQAWDRRSGGGRRRAWTDDFPWWPSARQLVHGSRGVRRAC